MNHAELAEFLGSLEIFSVLRKDEREELAAHTELQNFNFGDAVLNAGDPGNGLYVIKLGTVRKRWIAAPHVSP